MIHWVQSRPWRQGMATLALAALLATPWLLDARQAAKADVLVQEKQFARSVRTWFATEEGKRLLGPRQWAELSMAEAVTRALAENLNLKRERMQENIASQTVIAAAAAFDMAVNANLGYTDAKTYERLEKDKKFKNATGECTGACNDPDWPGLTNPWAFTTDDRYVVYPAGTPTSYIRYNQYRPAGFVDTEVEASKESVTGPSYATTLNLGLTDPLPWGMTANISQQTVNKPAYFMLNGSPTDPDHGNYRRPWASSLSANFNAPLPFSKDFGATATREVNLEQAGYNRERATVNSHGRANELVGAVENAYWSLVNAAGNLDAAMRNRQLVEALVKKTNRMFDAGRVAASGKSQVDAQLAKVQGDEILAANGYLQASNALNQLLKFQTEVVFLPVGFATDLQTVPALVLDEVLEKARAQNSANLLGDVDVTSAELNLRYRQQQTRPDLSFTASATGSQVNSPFGYRGYDKSMMNLADPDNITLTGTVAYRYPLFNQAAEAGLAQAREDHARRDTARTETGKRVDREVMNAYASLQSARERLAIAVRNLELAETSYAKALTLQELDDARRVTEYELLVKSHEIYNARLRHLQAMVEIKRNESTLQAAMGALEFKYGSAMAEVAVNRSERGRAP